MPELSERTKSRFFVAGMEILAEDGLGGLKLAALCRRLEVTTGSFYHSFDSWQEFTRQLVENWREERTLRAAELARVEVDPAERVELLLRLGVNLPHSAEAAIRVWAGLDAEVAAIQESVDGERLATATEAIAELSSTTPSRHPTSPASRSSSWWASSSRLAIETSGCSNGISVTAGPCSDLRRC